MAQNWDEWFRQAREEGMSRQAVRDHLHNQGYDPDPLMQQYWPSQPDDTDIPQQVRSQQERQASMVQTTDTYTSTILTVFSSPSGFFRRIQPTWNSAGRFLTANLLLFITLSTLTGTLIGLFFSNQTAPTLLISSLTNSLILGIQILIGGLIITGYLHLIFGILKGELSLAQTTTSVMYSSVVLLGAWIPIIGRFITLYAFKTIKEGIEEQVESHGHSYKLIFAPIILLTFIGIIHTLL